MSFIKLFGSVIIKRRANLILELRVTSFFGRNKIQLLVLQKCSNCRLKYFKMVEIIAIRLAFCLKIDLTLMF